MPFGVCYSKTTGQILYLQQPDDPSELHLPKNLLEDEEFTIVEGKLGSLSDVQTAIDAFLFSADRPK